MRCIYSAKSCLYRGTRFGIVWVCCRKVKIHRLWKGLGCSFDPLRQAPLACAGWEPFNPTRVVGQRRSARYKVTGLRIHGGASRCRSLSAPQSPLGFHAPFRFQFSINPFLLFDFTRDRGRSRGTIPATHKNSEPFQPPNKLRKGAAVQGAPSKMLSK